MGIIDEKWFNETMEQLVQKYCGASNKILPFTLSVAWMHTSQFRGEIFTKTDGLDQIQQESAPDFSGISVSNTYLEKRHKIREHFTKFRGPLIDELTNAIMQKYGKESSSLAKQELIVERKELTGKWLMTNGYDPTHFQPI